ncbi:MAG: Na/Pi cotransporter family protein [Defluviitaleaceae bacterium]|nr:Na/Pi cotransporter family protein [Defluviitaleaceae bacterium]
MTFLTNILSSVPAQLASAIFIFLFGLHFLAEGLKNATQDHLKLFFDKAIKNRVFGAIFGTIITGLTQSSTAVTVMTIGFVNAGLMTLLQAASIIVGANIGTTLTGHMMTIRFDAFVPILMMVGGLMFLFVKKEGTRQWGMVLFGFALFFIGLTGMSDAMRPLRDAQAFIDLILWLDGRILLGILVGAGISGLLNSSTASKGIIIMLAYQDILTLNIALPIIYGVNIGTCFTALLSSIQANKNAKRAALFHLLFSVVGTLIFIPITINGWFANFVINLNWPGNTDYAAVQVANAHTFFNIATAFVFLPILTPVLKFINLFIKDDDSKEILNPLDTRFLDNPAIAFDQAFKESLRMHDLAITNLEIASDALLRKKTNKLHKFFANEKKINQLEYEISDFLTSIPAEHLTESISAKIASMIKITSDIERIGDHAKNIAEAAQELKETELSFSEVAFNELTTMFKQTFAAVKAAYNSFEENDIQQAAVTIAYENEIDLLEEQLRDHHIDRLNKKTCRPRCGLIFLDTLSNLERIGDHSKNIAEYVIKSNSAV